ncbi:MAG: acyl-CoA dehydrogenase [Acidimicrobiales bacterium]|jgi:alkylation response protein AidB-like acyl-CoA dehydrogenase|nr:acyl-CoA dehydrogenase [Acidimicrobiales bacterium]
MSDEDPALVDATLTRLLSDHPPRSTDPVTFLRAQFDAGLAYVWFPRGYGGLDQPLSLQTLVDERLAAAGAPPSGRITNAIAAGQGAATIVTFGTELQKRWYLRPLFTAELLGCQLFSEPASGSDLASLATRAVRDGDEWVVNGQKVWTSGAQSADIAILLARTDPDAPKHGGLTEFVLDMRTSGVEVRPLRQMDGGKHFCEVFLTDVHIPDTERLGPVNEGWAVSQQTLGYERYNIPKAEGRGGGAIATVVAAWQARRDKDSTTARVLKAELMRHWAAVEVVRLLQLRADALRAEGRSGPEGSLAKLAMSVTSRRLAEWAPALLEGHGGLLDGYGEDEPHPWGVDEPLALACVRSPALAIAGGTDQIQRNIIGDRVLGLPREPALDRGMPWNRTMHNAT